MIKTSVSHPLQIDEVRVPHAAGLIGMTLCPGKKIPGIYAGVWDRDLDLDMRAIKAWGAQALISLMEDNEFPELSVMELPDKTRACAMEWYHLPIRDVHAPDERFTEGWETVGPRIREILSDGGRVVVHCRGGLGRTGTVAARLLVEFGMKPKDAIKAVRKARPGAIETREQEKYVQQCQMVPS